MVAQWLRFLWLLHRSSRTKKRFWTDVKPLLRNRFLLKAVPVGRNHNPSPPLLIQMMSGYWLSQAIYVAAKLGIADLLANGPKSSISLAASTASDERSLYRLMRSLASVGVFSQVGEDHFALSPLAEGLCTNVPGSLRATLITLGEIHYQVCGSLLQSVQTGSPSFAKVFGTGLFDYLSQNGDDADAFNHGMANLSSMLAYPVLMAYDFAGVSSIVDIGGGEGKLLEKVLDFYPGIQGTVFDMPATVEKAARQLSPGTCRCSYVGGDFFESVPEGAGLYLLCGVVHDWDDDHAVRILKNCRRAMAKNGRILLLETVMPTNSSRDFSKLLDLNMLVMTGGRERTKAEFSVLLGAAGYKLTKVVATMAPQSLIEAVPDQGSC